MKMAAQVTVTAGRRGEASAVSHGWRWRLSRFAGEEEDSDVINKCRAPVIYNNAHKFYQWWRKNSDFLLE